MDVSLFSGAHLKQTKPLHHTKQHTLFDYFTRKNNTAKTKLTVVLVADEVTVKL